MIIEFRIKLLLMTSLLSVLLTSSSVCADAKTTTVYVPVYFVTDRHSNGDMQYDDGAAPGGDMACGIRYWPQQIDSDAIADSELATLKHELGWQTALLNESIPSKVREKFKNLIPPGEVTESQSLKALWISTPLDLPKMTKELQNTRKQAGNPEILVFVHGFWNSFDIATKQAAALAVEFKMPVVAYCWKTPSAANLLRTTPKIIEYFGEFVLKKPDLVPRFPDFANGPWMMDSYSRSQKLVPKTIPVFQTFMTSLRADSGADITNKIVLLAHSMGTVVADTYLDGQKGVKFSEIIYSNSDLPNKDFFDKRSQRSTMADRFRIYINDLDAALWISKRLPMNGSVARLGSPPEDIRNKLGLSGFDIVDITKLGPDALGMTGHGMPLTLIAGMHHQDKFPTTLTITKPYSLSRYFQVSDIPPPITASNQKRTTRTKIVKSTNPLWTDLGDVSSQKLYNITVSGKWTNHKNAYSVNCFGRTDDYAANKNKECNPPPEDMNQPVAALIAKIGDNSIPMTLSSRSNWPPPASGRLMAIMNDGHQIDNGIDIGYTQNEGEMTVTIEEVRSQ